METPRKRNRKRYPIYAKAKAKERREKARIALKCDSLCGRDVSPGINLQTSEPYRSCELCRRRQAKAARRRKDAVKAAKEQTKGEATEATSEPIPPDLSGISKHMPLREKLEAYLRSYSAGE